MITIKNVSKFEDFQNDLPQKPLFRGLSSDKYNLIPSLLRPQGSFDNGSNVLELAICLLNSYGINTDSSYFTSDYPNRKMKIEAAESVLLYEFYHKCKALNPKIRNIECLEQFSDLIDFFNNAINKGKNEFYELPTIHNSKSIWDTRATEYEELSHLAQHYGLPTRLLDWTYDVNVALYFAVSGVLRKLEGYDSHSLTQLKNIYNSSFAIVVFSFRESFIQNMTNKMTTLRLVNYNNERSIAQNAVTLLPVSAVLCKPLASPNSNDYNDESLWCIDNNLENWYSALTQDYTTSQGRFFDFTKYVIPNKELSAVWKYVQSLGYSHSRIFPEYESIADDIKERLLFDKWCQFEDPLKS